MLFLYAVHLLAWPLMLGAGLPLPIYVHAHLWMIYRDRRARRPDVGTGETMLRAFPKML